MTSRDVLCLQAAEQGALVAVAALRPRDEGEQAAVDGQGGAGVASQSGHVRHRRLPQPIHQPLAHQQRRQHARAHAPSQIAASATAVAPLAALSGRLRPALARDSARTPQRKCAIEDDEQRLRATDVLSAPQQRRPVRDDTLRRHQRSERRTFLFRHADVTAQHHRVNSPHTRLLAKIPPFRAAATRRRAYDVINTFRAGRDVIVRE